MAEGLETRRVLSSLSTIPSASVSGTDADGDRWTLTLYGPGTINVVDPTGQAFTKANSATPDLIHTITVAGTVSHSSRLVGRVEAAGGGDGKVFFQNLNIQNNGAFGQIDANNVQRRGTTAQNGIALVDMPDFWLGRTSSTASTVSSDIHSGFFLAGGITAPEGVNVLRFGGVDVNYTPAGATPLVASAQKNEFVVNLGLPVTTGTSIIVDRVTTNAGTSTSTNQGNTTTTVNQQSVTFLVTGRINLFQANQIDGNTANGLAPTQFDATADTPTAGGTYLVSQAGEVTGQIGYVRVGGPATNFTTFAIATSIFSGSPGDTLDPKVTNFLIGGETDNVMLIAPGGSRDVSFGRGMDNVVINSQWIQHLHANRGAVNSKVTVSRTLDNLKLGADLVNSLIQSGYTQTLTAEAVSPGSVFSAGGGAFNGVAPKAIDNRTFSNIAGASLPSAHGGGGINAQIAGSVVSSVVSVSVDPDPSGLNDPGEFQQVTTKRFPFGAPENVVLPRGYINVKLEGEVDNSAIQGTLVSPDVPSDTAFFAKHVDVVKGAAFPPKVDTAPFNRKLNYGKAQKALKGLWKV
ncbi:hypothetical protein [Planctomyces sp. SH-PL62]|uniref:hypothetical protein n=1 Tax=Planctomyces sp. SH-PL62 TaxID=1636152 RepID=UPI00078C4110|nr:hypothetical protein [Planctomyces sp. SH-PL62]AMV40051.1 hypothetical protein VT85_21635 [Planctomyces sp. SH-PL62]